MSNLIEIFSQEFQYEYRLVDAIKKYLLTDEQKQFLFDNYISIEDILNGRVQGSDKIMNQIRDMLREWNKKIGKKVFFEEQV